VFRGGTRFRVRTMQIECDQEDSTDRSGAWERGPFMLLFAAAFGAGQSLLSLLAALQFLWLLFAGDPL